jgi:hypothetical protein
MSLHNMMQQGQLNQYRVQEEGLKAQAAEEDRRDWQTIQQAYAHATATAGPGKKLDLGSVRNEIASQVNPRNLQAFDKSVLEHSTALMRQSNEQLKYHQDRNAEISKRLQAVISVKPDQRAGEWAKQIAQAERDGLIEPGSVSKDYSGDEQLTAFDIQTRGAAAHLKDEDERRKAEQEAAMNPLRVEEQRGKVTEQGARADTATRATAAAQLGNAQNAEEYSQIKAALKPEVAAQFPDPSNATGALNPDFLTNIRRRGMTPAQQGAEITHEQTARDTAAHRKILEKNAGERLSIEGQRLGLERERLNRQAGIGPIDKRQGQTFLFKFGQQENTLNKRRTELGNALTSGRYDKNGNLNPPKLFVNRLGEVVPMSKQVPDGDEETIRGLAEHMKGDYQSVTDELKGTVRETYSVLGRMGSEPQIPQDEVLAQLDRGTQALWDTMAGRPKAQPGRPARAAATPKAPAPAATLQVTPQKVVGTETQFRQRAKARGFTDAQVAGMVQRARAQGSIQ